MARRAFTVRADEMAGLPVWHVVDPDGCDRSSYIYEAHARASAARLNAAGFPVCWLRRDGAWVLAAVVQSMADADAEAAYLGASGVEVRVGARLPAAVLGL